MTFVAKIIATLVVVSASAMTVDIGAAGQCPPNPDALYRRKNVLRQLAATLNRSIPEYRSIRKKGFYVDEEEKPVGFFIHDLVDVSNKETTPRECIKLLDGHIYHFAPISYPFSFSHIVILKGRQMTVFRSINCSDRGDSISDVIRYIEETRKHEQDDPEVFKRLRDFRNYGVYTRIDSFATLQCKEDVP